MGLYAPLIKGYIMERNIEKYLKVYQVLSEEESIKTVNALEEKDKEFQTHHLLRIRAVVWCICIGVAEIQNISLKA